MTIYKFALFVLVLLLLTVSVGAQETQNISVPSFDVTVAENASESGDKPYGMLIDVPEEVELATIVINGIALDLTGGTVILWRDDIIADTNAVGTGEEDFETNRRPSSWSMSVTKGLVKMRVVDPELAEELGDQEIVVTEGAALSYDEEAVAQGEQVFDIEPFKAEDIEELQSVVSAVDEDAELTVLTAEQVQVVEESQELLVSIENLSDAEIASDLIIENTTENILDDSLSEFDDFESDTAESDQDNLVQFLIESGELTPEELGDLAIDNPEIGELIMNSILFEDDSVESLSLLAEDNPEMFDFFVDIVAVDDRAVDYFLEVSAENEAFVDEWDLYIAEDPAFADAFVGRFDDPAASLALSDLAGESLYINELMLDMTIYDPLFADELVDVWETNPDSAQFFFDTVMQDEDALLDAQFIFAENIDAFDPIVDGWASDPTLEFAEFYDDFGADELFTGYEIDYSFGASIVACTSRGDGSSDIEIAFINEPAGIAEIELFGNGSRTVTYESYLFLNVRDSLLPIFSIDAYDATGNLLETTFVDDGGCDSEFGGGFDDPFGTEEFGAVFYDEFEDPALLGGSSFEESGAFGLEIIGCFSDGLSSTIIDMTVYNPPQNADSFYIYSMATVEIVSADGFVSVTIPDSDLPLNFAEAYDPNSQYIDFAYFEGIPCDGSSDGEFVDEFEDPTNLDGEEFESTGSFAMEIVSCSSDGLGSTIIDVVVSNIPQATQDFYIYTASNLQIISADSFISITVPDSELPLNFAEAYDTNSQYIEFAFFEGQLCSGGGVTDEFASEDPAGEFAEGFTAEIIDCTVSDSFNTSVTLMLSNVPDGATDMVVSTQTGSLSVFPDTTTFLTIETNALPISFIEVGNGVETFDSASPTGLSCEGSDTQETDSDGDGYTDGVDFCPFEGDTGNGVDEFGCPIAGGTDSDQDGVTDDVDSCPFEGNTGNGVDEFGCPNAALDSDGDGYADDVDSCPAQGDTGNGVDEFGCPVAALDSDGDGVTDDVDSCPAQGDEGNGVDEFGCPNAALDSDGDGVTDEIDSCPFEGDTGNGIDEFGCPNPAPDSDGDGYADDVDSCPAQGDEGNGVDEFGCPIAAPTATPIPDSDGDGFTDDVDSCPAQGDEGNGVDGTGCPNPAVFAVSITGCQNNGDGTTTVDFLLSNIPGEAAFILFYHSGGSGISGGVSTNVQLTTSDANLPFTRVDVERSTSPFLIADAVPSGSCP